jgi:hypothetical protein
MLDPAYGVPSAASQPHVIYCGGKIVSRFRNLRGVLFYARKHGVKEVTLAAQEDHAALVYFQFVNGGECWVSFNSYTVAQGWIRSRRSWGLHLEHIGARHEVWGA